MVKTIEGTVYSSIPMQLFMTHAIKAPILESVNTIFNPDASKIDKLKATRNVWKAIQAMNKLPEPTIETTWHPNTHNLIILRDWLFERCFLGVWRVGLMRRVINFVIILYDFDPPWRWVMDSMKDEGLKMEWRPRGYGQDEHKSYAWWKE